MRDEETTLTFQYRLRPEDIVLNIGQDAPVPVPNIEGEWKKVG